MNVSVLGATGRTGRPLVDELLRRGHRVSVLVRDPARLGEHADRVQVVQGDSRDEAALARLVSDADAVVSALGPTSRDASVHSDTARALVSVMRAAGATRFVGVSGAGVDVPGDQKAARDRVISTAIRVLGGELARDKAREYAVFADSDLQWTLIRPPRLVDGEPTGRIEHDAHRSTRSTSMVRSDLAHLVVDVLERGMYVREAPFAATAKG